SRPRDPPPPPRSRQAQGGDMSTSRFDPPTPLLVMLACLTLLAACEVSAPHDGAAPATPQPLAESTDRVLLDARAQPSGALPTEIWARLLPVPANADPDRVLVLETDLPSLGVTAGTRVLDVRYTA